MGPAEGLDTRSSRLLRLIKNMTFQQGQKFGRENPFFDILVQWTLSLEGFYTHGTVVQGECPVHGWCKAWPLYIYARDLVAISWLLLIPLKSATISNKQGHQVLTEQHHQTSTELDDLKRTTKTDTNLFQVLEGETVDGELLSPPDMV